MLRVYTIFFGARNTRPWLVLACLILAGLCDVVSLSTLLPVAASIGGGVSSESSRLSEVVSGIIADFGLTPTLGTMIAIVVLFMFFKALLSFAALGYAGISAARVAVSLRRRLLAAAFSTRWSHYADQSAGAYANAISNDAGRAGDSYMMAAQAVAFSVQTLAYSLVAIFVNWRLALLALGVGAILGTVMSSLVRVTKRAGARQTKRTMELSRAMVDMLNNIKPIKAMARESRFLEGLEGTLRSLGRSLVAREVSKQGVAQGSDLAIAALVGAGVYVAATYWQTPMPELIVSGLVFFQFVNTLSKFQRLVQMAATVESAYLQVEEMIDEAEKARETSAQGPVPAKWQEISLDYVTFSHARKPVVRGATVEIPRDGVVVLQGPSGAGKTTIVDLLIGLHRPDSGSIRIDSVDLSTIDIRAWRRRIGYVPQEFSLMHGSIRENITLGSPDIGDAEIKAALQHVDALDFVVGLPQGLDTDVGEMGAKLSGGQRQRISLARALVTQPDILILDEVTSALDPSTEASIIANIAKLARRFTIVAITHRPAWSAIATRLYEVEGGAVRLIGKRQAAGRDRRGSSRRKR